MSSLSEAVAAFEWEPAQQPAHKGARTSSEDGEALQFGTLGDVMAATYQSARAAGGGVLSHLLWRRQAPKTPLQQVPWLQQLCDEHGYEKVIDKATLQAKSGLFPEDHMFKVMTHNSMLRDNIVLFKCGPAITHHVVAHPQGIHTHSSSCEVVAVYQLGQGVCGHAGIVHGGMTSALIDETCGYLLYLARSQGVLDFKAVLTAQLEVSYKRPLTPTNPLTITACISELSGRKIWVNVTVTDMPECITTSPASSTASLGDTTVPARKVFATGRALFIIPRTESASAATLEQAGKGSSAVLGGLRRKDEGNPADV